MTDSIRMLKSTIIQLRDAVFHAPEPLVRLQAPTGFKVMSSPNTCGTSRIGHGAHSQQSTQQY